MTKRKAVAPSDMRDFNLSLIIDHIRKFAPVSRSEVAEMTGLNKATVSSTIKTLIEQNIVTELGIRDWNTDIGRPSIDLIINQDAGRIIGAELSETSLTTVISGISSKILWQNEEKLPASGDKEVILECIKTTLINAYKEAKDCGYPVLGLGLSVPGLVDITTGTVLYSPHLGWENVPLKQFLQKDIDIPVYIGNESHMSAVGECYFGKMNHYDHVLYISAGLGLSGAIILNGDVLSGARGLAGEIGHMTVDADGEECSCKNHGCWETMANQKALFKRIENAVSRGRHSILLESTENDLSRLSISLAADAAREGDKVAVEAFEETGYWLGIGIANLITIFNPQLVVLGGAISCANEFLLPVIQEEVVKRTLLWLREPCKIITSSYGKDAGVIGAAATVFWELLNHPQDLLDSF